MVDTKKLPLFILGNIRKGPLVSLRNGRQTAGGRVLDFLPFIVCAVAVTGVAVYLNWIFHPTRQPQLTIAIVLISLAVFAIAIRLKVSNIPRLVRWNMTGYRLITDLTARVVIITSVYAILLYLVITRYGVLFEQAIPSLFIMYGIVILISVLFDLWRYHVASAMPVKAKWILRPNVRLITEFTIRVVGATFMFSVISYLVVIRYGPWWNTTVDQLAIGIPVLFVMFGIVMMITIPFLLWKDDVMGAVVPSK